MYICNKNKFENIKQNQVYKNNNSYSFIITTFV